MRWRSKEIGPGGWGSGARVHIEGEEGGYVRLLCGLLLALFEGFYGQGDGAGRFS